MDPYLFLRSEVVSIPVYNHNLAICIKKLPPEKNCFWPKIAGDMHIACKHTMSTLKPSFVIICSCKTFDMLAH